MVKEKEDKKQSLRRNPRNERSFSIQSRIYRKNNKSALRPDASARRAGSAAGLRRTMCKIVLNQNIPLDTASCL